MRCTPIASNGLEITIITAFGETFAAFSATSPTIRTFVDRRSSLLIPGLPRSQR